MEKKLEKQVVNLELSKKLKELGVKQESYFIWADNYLTNHREFARDDAFMYVDKIPAYTVAELGEMLPYHINKDGALHSLEMWKNHDDTWGCIYVKDGDDPEPKSLHWEEADNLSDAMAKMLIYLIENDFYKI